MSNQPHFKPLYEFTVDVPKEIEKETSRQEGDKTITEKIKVVEPVPQFFCFKRLSRVEREEADLYRSSQWAYFVKRGLMAEALLVRDYTNGGGILSDSDQKRWIETRVKLVDKMREYQMLQANKESDRAIEVSKEMMMLQDEIISLQNQQSVFFENTAEARARSKLTIYLALMFTYTKDAPEKQWEPYFKGATIEEKLAILDELEEGGSEIFVKVWNRVSMLSILYISAGGSITKEDIDSFDKEFAQPTEQPAAVTPNGDAKQ